MPAHPDRQQVLLRLYPADLKKLDDLVGIHDSQSRTALMVKLIGDNYAALPPRKRRQLEKEPAPKD